MRWEVKMEFKIHPTVVMRGAEEMRGLADINLKLIVIQAISLMAEKGLSTTTATDVARIISEEYQTRVSAQKVGELLRFLGVESRLSHSKHRYVLEPCSLAEIHRNLSSKCQDIIKRVEMAMENYGSLLDKFS